MLRVLLVLEDYGEMLFLQTLMKKMGFDVDGVQNSRTLNDSILNLNPDILIMTAFGKRVNGFDLSQGLRRPRGLPKVVLMHPAGTPTPPAGHVEGWVVSPTTALEFLRKISQIGGLDIKQIEDKYHRLTISQQIGEPEGDYTKGPVGPAAPSAKVRIIPGSFEVPAERANDREQRNKNFLAKEKVPKDIQFNRKQIEDNVKELRRSENPERMATLEKERREFVKEMFKKKA